MEQYAELFIKDVSLQMFATWLKLISKFDYYVGYYYNIYYEMLIR